MEIMKLSTNLEQIELEINYHKKIAGQSIWEIGRRLNHVKENDLVYGEFGEWLEKVDMSNSQASRFMKVAKELPSFSSEQKLGITALYLIATLPEVEREKEHELESGKTKAVDEMTVRELQEVKRKNRQQEERIKELESKGPEVVEKIIEKEIVPHDYDGLKSDNQQLELGNQNLERQIRELKQQQQDVDGKSKKYDDLNEAMQEMNGRLNEGQRQLKAQKEVYDLIKQSERAIEELAPLSYLIDADTIIGNDYAKRPIKKIADNLDEISNRLRNTLEGITIIEG